MVGRRQVAFLGAVAGAGLADAAGAIDTQPVDGVARPSAAVALNLQRVFGGEDAAVAQRLGLKLKIALLAKQPEPVADFPYDLQRRVRGGGLRCGRLLCCRRLARAGDENIIATTSGRAAITEARESNRDFDCAAIMPCFNVKGEAEIRRSPSRRDHLPGTCPRRGVPGWTDCASGVEPSWPFDLRRISHGRTTLSQSSRVPMMLMAMVNGMTK